MASHLNAANQNRIGPDQATVADLRGLAANFADGNVLIDAAVSAYGGVPGDIDTVKPMRERGDSGDFCAPANIAAPPVGDAVEEKGEDIGQKLAVRTIPEVEQPPIDAQIVSQRVVHQRFSKVHVGEVLSNLLLTSIARPAAKCNKKSGLPSPVQSQSKLCFQSRSAENALLIRLILTESQK